MKTKDSSLPLLSGELYMLDYWKYPLVIHECFSWTSAKNPVAYNKAYSGS